jgi:hypothetical protein
VNKAVGGRQGECIKNELKEIGMKI